ncbi:VOC family protein [Oceanicoccus sp. KOV_DT_Chl]|uniref:VOC family protein n=1 Tax=Oceanicoccus sp. KOV_DT_Chl TaxID=1904639 RepID=UPI000C7CEE04|nr:VOC family protein [Oceanicoccus sp. KOV_DT_Chl]
MAARLGQYCVAVTDLKRSEDFYTRIIGLQVLQRIEIEGAREIVLGAAGSDNKIQLAQREDITGPIDHGNALWKFYLYIDDIETTYQAALDYGCQSEMEPQRLEEWPVTVAFIIDPDGYRIELLQSH